MNALAIFRGACNVRTSPDLSASSRFMTSVPDAAALIGLSSVPDAQGYRWLHVQFDDGRGDGYTREDVTYVVGDVSLWGGGKLADPAIARLAIPGATNGTATFTGSTTGGSPSSATQPVTSRDQPSPTTGDRWPSPVAPYVITEPYQGPGGHLGTDLAGASGTPVYARGKGIVYSADDCPACAGGNGAVMGTSDPRSNFGFGVNVVTRHQYSDLPSAAQKYLDGLKLTNGYVFVRVAHLSSKVVGKGASVSDGTLLGYRGTSGNSSGPHTHLEVRASMNSQPSNVFNEPLVDPAQLFAF